MGAYSYHALIEHVGHKIVCVTYGNNDNVAIECETCCEVLLDFDRPPITHYCTRCHQHQAVHNDDGSCVED